jgi:thymidylate synthase (FAD)
VDSDPEFFFPEAWRARPEKSIKQGSGGMLPDEMQEYLASILQEGVDEAIRTYRCFLDAGVAPEQARMILPQSMYTEWVETGSLYFWARFCKLRLDPHAQAEIREYARLVSEAIGPLFPYSWKALVIDNG